MNEAITTLGRVHDYAAQLADAHWDELVPVKDISFDGLDVMRIGQSEYQMNTTAKRCVASRLNIPMQYLDRCPSYIQASNMNFWIMREKNEKLFVRFDGCEIRALFSPRYVPADNVSVLDRLGQMGFGLETEVQVAIDSSYMMINIPEKGRQFEVKAGDCMLPGLSISNNEVGLSSLRVSAFILRLVCSNGMVARSKVGGFAKRHVHRNLVEELPQMIASTVNHVDIHRDRMLISMESRVDNYEETFARLNSQFQLDQQQREAVAWGFEYEKVESNTMFEIIQSYTKGAQHPALSAAQTYNLQDVGGKVLALMQ